MNFDGLKLQYGTHYRIVNGKYGKWKNLGIVLVVNQPFLHNATANERT